jgi:hypothetical protein
MNDGACFLLNGGFENEKKIVEITENIETAIYVYGMMSKYVITTSIQVHLHDPTPEREAEILTSKPRLHCTILHSASQWWRLP